MSMIKIHNAETGEVIEREMNEEELAQQAKDQADEIKRQAEIQAEAQVRQAILNRLGLSEEEARLLLG